MWGRLECGDCRMNEHHSFIPIDGQCLLMHCKVIDAETRQLNRCKWELNMLDIFLFNSWIHSPPSSLMIQKNRLLIRNKARAFSSSPYLPLLCQSTSVWLRDYVGLCLAFARQNLHSKCIHKHSLRVRVPLECPRMAHNWNSLLRQLQLQHQLHLSLLLLLLPPPAQIIAARLAAAVAAAQCRTKVCNCLWNECID